MSKTKITIPLAVMLFLWTALPGFASDQPLTQSEVERWIASMDELRNSSEVQEPLFMLTRSVFDSSPGDFEELGNEVVEASPSMDTVLEKHGFADGREWSSAWVQIWNAFLYSMMSENLKESRARLAAQRQEIEADSDLSEEERTMLLEEIDFAEQNAVMTVEAPEADVAVVQDYRDELEPLFQRLMGRR